MGRASVREGGGGVVIDEGNFPQSSQRGDSLQPVFDALVQAVEAKLEGRAVAAILVLDGDGKRLRHGAAPSLPSSYNLAIDGIAIGPVLGTCGSAAYRNKTIVTPDIEHDPGWSAFKGLPLGLGLRAAWSLPIRSAKGRVLGTFGTYFRECRVPTPMEREIVGVLAKSAAIAIERRQNGLAPHDGDPSPGALLTWANERLLRERGEPAAAAMGISGVPCPDYVSLMVRIADGDVAAFKQLYDNLATPLYFLVVHIVKSRADAEDVLQIGFQQVWRFAKRYRPDLGTPFGWIATIMRRKAIDHLRSCLQRAQLIDAAFKDCGEELDAEKGAKQLIAGDQQLILRGALAQLNDGERQAIELAYFYGLTQVKIAQSVGTPVGTVKSTIRRGLLKLRRKLTDLGDA